MYIDINICVCVCDTQTSILILILDINLWLIWIILSYMKETKPGIVKKNNLFAITKVQKQCNDMSI